MSVIGWPSPRRDERFTVNRMDMSYLATLLARGTRATSSTKTMISQLYRPHYLVIRSEVSCKAPAQRPRAGILRRRVRGRLLGAKIGANVGVFGIDTSTPIINSGESAIVGMGVLRRRPSEHKGKIKLRDVATLAL